ncbi:MAG TPA: hypothetical protein VKI64_11195 [Acidimicrobiales bacterium]|nr:hypothetical protein [Acidimicrobiales bacterium]
MIHVKDQGGLLTMRDPTYLGIGYFLLEGAGIAAAAVLLSRLALRSWAWLLALGVAAGPFFGFLLSRGPGLPSAMDDRGNWTEPLGLMSAVVEGILMLLAVAAFVRTRSGAAVRQS